MNELLPCPFCGGKVAETQDSWNICHAECQDCKETWGHCGAMFEGRHDKWNARVNKKGETD